MTENETPLPDEGAPSEPQVIVETPVVVDATPAVVIAPIPVVADEPLPTDEDFSEASLDVAEANRANGITTAKAGEPTIPLDKDGKPVPKDNPKAYKPRAFPRGMNQHITKIPLGSIIKPIAHTEDGETPFRLAAIPCDGDTFNSMLESYPSINFGHGVTSREWAAEIDLAGPMLNQLNFLSKAVERDGTYWAQRVPFGAPGNTMGPTRPALGKTVEAGAKLSGDQAVALVMQDINAGAPITIPLWHSGFWVSFKAPTLMARLELQRRIDAEKITLGRMTNGMAYSNMSVYIKGFLVDFALAHLSTANVRYRDPQDLKDLILTNDIPALVWAMLATMYPSGYPYHQPCVNDPSACQHIVKAILDINKIYFVDTQALTETQLAHMANRGTRYEEKDLKAYQAQHRYNTLGKVQLQSRTGKIGVQLKVPTISEYLSSGYAWVDGITNDIQRAFGQDLTGERRNHYIMERAQVSSMGEYSHWVAQIALSNGATIEDVETIRSTLVGISGSTDIAEAFFKDVQVYMDDATISLIALPRYDCPRCGKEATVEEQEHPYLLPLDVETLFFTTAAQHIAKAAA